MGGPVCWDDDDDEFEEEEEEPGAFAEDESDIVDWVREEGFEAGGVIGRPDIGAVWPAWTEYIV